MTSSPWARTAPPPLVGSEHTLRAFARHASIGVHAHARSFRIQAYCQQTSLTRAVFTWCQVMNDQPQAELMYAQADDAEAVAAQEFAEKSSQVRVLWLCSESGQACAPMGAAPTSITGGGGPLVAAPLLSFTADAPPLLRTVHCTLAPSHPLAPRPSPQSHACPRGACLGSSY